MEKTKEFCLYLDEIIDVRLLSYDKALVCSNNEMLKVVELASGAVHQSSGGHEDIILCLDTYQGEYFLTGSKDNTARLWTYKDERLQCRAVFAGHNESVASVCFAPKKMGFFVSASQDNTIKVWADPRAHAESDTVAEVNSATMTVMAHQKYINVVKVSPNDKLIASASQDKTIKIWNSQDLMLTQTLAGHKKGVWDCSFSPVDKMLVSASGDKTVKVWNLATGACLATLQGHLTSLVKVAWLNAGLQIVSASVDGVVKLWNLKKQACVNTIQMHEEKIWGIDVSGDKHILTGGGDSTLKLWDDCTIEHDHEEKEKQLQRLQDEQKLSALIREEDFVEAAIVAFRLNKLRDFYLVINKVQSNSGAKADPVDSVLQDRAKFRQFIESTSLPGKQNLGSETGENKTI